MGGTPAHLIRDRKGKGLWQAAMQGEGRGGEGLKGKVVENVISLSKPGQKEKKENHLRTDAKKIKKGGGDLGGDKKK